jgi:murein DD-endopeptidase MepM/ murein hydrolase activator NlpD
MYFGNRPYPVLISMKFIITYYFFGCVLFAQSVDEPKNSILSVISNLNTIDTTEIIPETFNLSWVDSLKLQLPCDNVLPPKRTMRLPNAPRDYRSGTHRGIDFFANWGTPVKAVSDGIVIRADHGYEEVPADFRVNMLSASAKVGNTPSDIFNSILLGRAIFLDHGFDLIPGFRVITIYAHLSHIDKNIIPGAVIKAGDVIGKSGNSGTRESTVGLKAGAHLHWEMILQKGKQEIYLGKDVPNPQLYAMLRRIFYKANP